MIQLYVCVYIYTHILLQVSTRRFIEPSLRAVWGTGCFSLLDSVLSCPGRGWKSGTLQVQRPSSAWLRACTLAASCFSHTGADGGSAVSLTVNTQLPASRPLETCWFPRARLPLLSGQPEVPCVVRAEAWSHGTAPAASLPAPGPSTWKDGRKGGVGSVGRYNLSFYKLKKMVQTLVKS